MSYDVHLLRSTPDPAATYQALEENEQPAPTPDEERAWRAVAGDLRALEPELRLGDSGAAAFWSLSLLGREVCIDIYPDHAVVSFSYRGGDFAAKVDELARYVEVFERHGLVAYDPQSGRPFVAERDAAEIAETAAWVRTRTVANIGGQSRPLWRRMIGR